MIQVRYDHEPEPVRYMPLPEGKADVWIRKFITEKTDDESPFWTAAEAYFRTTLSRAEVEAEAETLFFRHTDIEKELTDAVQDYMDRTVHKRNYDSIFTACSYATSTNAKFRAEGKACVAWRDAVWDLCYTVLNDVIAGQRAIPTKEELLAELPVLEW